jgi:hypothetical protein
VNWAIYQKNISILLVDIVAEEHYAAGAFVGENSEPLLCRLEDEAILNTGLTMLMFQGDPLMKRVNEVNNAWLKQVYTTTGILCALTVLNYFPGRQLSFTHLMNITASNCITCNLASICF